MIRLICWVFLWFIAIGQITMGRSEVFEGPIRVPEFANRALERQLRQRNRHVREASELDKRLPMVAKPSEYFIRIQPYYPVPNLAIATERLFTFDGNVRVTFRITAATNNITMHSRNLNFTGVALTDSNGSPLVIGEPQLDDQLSHITIVPMESPIVGNEYHLIFNYTGIINQNHEGGLFWSSYLDQDRVEHFMICTYLEEGAQARSVFPAFDEPAYKAIFHTTLVYPSQHIALANMPESTPNDLGNGWSEMVFPATPIMSCYLVAFATGPFVSSKPVINQAGTMVRAWAWPSMEPYLDFAADTAARCLDALGTFLNFTFPLPKSDQLGLPQFRIGAEENWGLVTYKYQYVAYNPDILPTPVKHSIAEVMCHELAHQWFGDLVTTAWWDDLFLNEGFAEFFEEFDQELIFPEQHDFFEMNFIPGIQQAALSYDANVFNSHPISTLQGDSFTGPLFDTITYEKGASLLRMLNYTLGREVLQMGLRQYIQEHKFDNANHEDLWSALTTAAQNANVTDWCNRPMNLSLFMNPWILQQGFPLISVNNSDPMTGPKYSQRPFNDRMDLPPNPYNYSWPIPLFVNGYHNGRELIWLQPAYDQCSTTSTKISESKNLHWQLANSASRSFLRVEYDEEGFARVLAKLKASSDSISVETRTKLMGDTITMLNKAINQNQPFSYANFLDLTKLILARSFDYAPFRIALPILDNLNSRFLFNQDYPLFERYMTSLLSQAYTTLGWNSSISDWNTNTARYVLLPYAVRYDISDARNQSRGFFDLIRTACRPFSMGTNGCNPLHPDIRPAVYCGAVMSADDEDKDNSIFADLLSMYMGQVTTEIYFYQEYQAQLQGLACSKKKDNILSFIAQVLVSPTLLSSNVLAYLKVNPSASEAMLDYARNAPRQVLRSDTVFDRYLETLIATWHLPKNLQMYQDLNMTLSPWMSTDQLTMFNMYGDRLAEQIQWTIDYLPDIVLWLYDNYAPISQNPWLERLPTSLWSNSYDVILQPFFPSNAQHTWNKDFTVEGSTSINFTVLSSTSTISLTMHRMIVDQDSLQLSSSMNISTNITIIGFYKRYDAAFLVITLSETLPINSTWTLSMRHRGFIFKKPSAGVDINYSILEYNGQKSWIFTTDFEGGPNLRSLLPSFDEPSYKATWRFTVYHPSDMTALSNGPLAQKRILTGGWTRSIFEMTPPMTSYLVAIVIGNLAAQQTMTQSGTRISLWTWTGYEQYGGFALKVAVDTLEYMGPLLNFTYMLPKADIVALPQYTGSHSAMENWGLIISHYHEVLVHPDYAMAEDYSLSAFTVSHELTHHWFGDLITMDWWNDLFLNEGFATFFVEPIVNYSQPMQNEAFDYHRFDDLTHALRQDLDPNNLNPVIYDKPPLFSAQKYEKASSLFVMISAVMGEEVFRRGLQEYIAQQAYRSATPVDLWRALTNAAHSNGLIDWDGHPLNLLVFADPWFTQAVFPVLRVTASNGIVRYNQEPMVNISQLPINHYGYQWPIPIFSQTINGTIGPQWFIGPTGSNNATWTRPVSNDWRVENVGAVSYVRVLYDDTVWAPILGQLKSDPLVFEMKTRAMLLDDTIALQKRGDLSWNRLLDTTMYLVKELSYAPWASIRSTLNMLMVNFKTQPEYPRILSYIRNISSGAFNRFPWTVTGIWTIDWLSATVTDLSCRAQSPSCLAVAQQHFEDFISSCHNSQSGTGLCNSLQADQRRNQYCYGLSGASNVTEIIRRLYDWMQNHSIYFLTETDNLLYALTCFNDDSHINRMIREIVSGILPSITMSYVAENDLSTMRLWNYFIVNKEDVLYSVVSFSSYVNAMVTAWNTQEQLDLLQSFLSSTNSTLFGDVEINVWNGAIGMVQNNIRWISENKPQIVDWLNVNNIH